MRDTYHPSWDRGEDKGLWWEPGEQLRAAADAERAGDAHGPECRCHGCSLDAWGGDE